jgi:hypothetical protein
MSSGAVNGTNLPMIRHVNVGLTDGSGLSLRQVAVIDALACGRTPTQAAVACKVARVTIYEWLKHDDFRAGLQTRRRELAVAMADRIAELGDAAVGALLGYLREEHRSDFDVLPAHIKLAERLLNSMGLMGGVRPADRD